MARWQVEVERVQTYIETIDYDECDQWDEADAIQYLMDWIKDGNAMPYVEDYYCNAHKIEEDNG